MSSFDFGAKVAFDWALSSNITANTNTGAIDTQGFEGVSVVSVVGVTENISNVSAITLNFKEGNDTNIANATDVALSNVISNPPIEGSNVAVHASVRTTKRYLFAEYVVPANGSAIVGCAGALGYPHNSPTY